MNFERIVSKEVQDYIKANLNSDLPNLLLKKSPFEDISMADLVQQIKGHKVGAKKFPSLLEFPIIFPPNLNLEQTSSENTAKYKANLVSGKSMLDLTSGFGIDAYFLSQNFSDVTLVERNSELLDLVKINWKSFGKEANFISSELEHFLNDTKSTFDVVYLDPARRDQNKQKVFLLEDLSPNILEIQDRLFELSERILIKLSPLIDLKYLIQNVKGIERIHLVAVKNEVKEVLLHLKKDADSQECEIACVNLESSEPVFTFNWKNLYSSKVEYNDALNFLYLPNNALLKSGAFDLVAQEFHLYKLHQNTHLYTSKEIRDDFPGRILKVEKIDAKSLRKREKYNIVSKNHPLKPEDIKKKYKLQDGGKGYLIFTQSIKGKIILKSSDL